MLIHLLIRLNASRKNLAEKNSPSSHDKLVLGTPKTRANSDLLAHNALDGSDDISQIAVV